MVRLSVAFARVVFGLRGARFYGRDARQPGRGTWASSIDVGRSGICRAYVTHMFLPIEERSDSVHTPQAQPALIYNTQQTVGPN